MSCRGAVYSGAILLSAGLLCSRNALAQQGSAPLTPGLEVSAGIEWMGSASFGTTTANEVVAAGGVFPLFSVSSELGGAVGARARIAKRLTSLLSVEASGSYSRPELRSTTAADVESAAPVTAPDRLRQFTVEGAVLFTRSQWRIRGRALPFLSAGAGYLRHLHEGDTFVQGGQIYSVGGGVDVPLLSRGAKRVSAVGLHADARAVVRSHGAAIDGRSHVSPALGVSVYLGLRR